MEALSPMSSTEFEAWPPMAMAIAMADLVMAGILTGCCADLL